MNLNSYASYVTAEVRRELRFRLEKAIGQTLTDILLGELKADSSTY